MHPTRRLTDTTLRLAWLATLVTLVMFSIAASQGVCPAKEGACSDDGHVDCPANWTLFSAIGSSAPPPSLRTFAAVALAPRADSESDQKVDHRVARSSTTLSILAVAPKTSPPI